MDQTKPKPWTVIAKMDELGRVDIETQNFPSLLHVRVLLETALEIVCERLKEQSRGRIIDPSGKIMNMKGGQS